MKSYNNGELVTPQNPKANVEYHCFELDRKGRPKYVRGTYGNRGYFEGVVRAGVATVNFYEVSLVGSSLIPTTGAAVLTYRNDWTDVHGPFWNGGGSNISMPTDWGITGPCKNCLKGRDLDWIVANKCLWDRQASRAPDVPVNVNNMVFGDSSVSLSTFRNAVFGPSDTQGTTAGGYWYLYSPEACQQLNLPCEEMGNVEYGYYGYHAVSAGVAQAKIFVSTWNAVTGPAAGRVGSGVYAITKRDDAFSVNGIFCYAYYDEEEHASLGSCTSDGGPSTMPLNSSQSAEDILHHYTYGEDFEDFSVFFSELVGSRI